MPHGREDKLKLDKLPIKVDIANIDQLSNDDYIMARRNGFGSSDSSILLGVNPYQNIEELVCSKLLTHVTEEERAIGEKTAVKKGRDLEPMIMDKASLVLNVDLIKPIDMYRFKEHPQLTINYDGVTDTPEQYIPVEIKVVTRPGERHYDFSKAIYRELQPLNPMIIEPKQNKEWYRNTTIEERAYTFGIPPYYYTQLNQEMFGLDAPYGYLAVLLDSSWELVIFHIYRDEFLLKRLVTVSEYQWSRIEQAKQDKEL